MDEPNPFEAPSGSEQPSVADPDFVAEVARHSRGVLGWFALFGLVSCGMGGLSVFFGILMVVMPTVGGAVGSINDPALDELGGTVVIGVFYLVLGALYAVPGLAMMNAGYKAVRLRGPDPEPQAVLVALKARNLVWHVFGGGCLGLMVLYGLVIAGACFLGAFAAV